MNATLIVRSRVWLILVLASACGTNNGTGSPSGAGGDTHSSRGGAETANGGQVTHVGGNSAVDTTGSSGTSFDRCDAERPGPGNTGVRDVTRLIPSGSIKVETPGELVENLDIDGEITILADNVTIRNVRIKSGDYYPIRYFDNNNVGLVVEDCEIEGTSDDVTAGISFANYTARRVNVHGTADGFKADENVLIEDSWIHDLRNAPEQHNDGVQSTGGKGVTLRHNSISGASNACVQTGDEGAATEDLTVECNWLSGGGYTLNIRGTGETRPKNTKILYNRFTRDAEYGPWTIDDLNPTIVGNTYEDGSPIEDF
jgi:hypothetical protein